MEEMKSTATQQPQNPQHPAQCQCANCTGRYGKFRVGHWLLAALIGLVILAIVFLLGFKLGEMRGAFGHRRFSSYGAMGAGAGRMNSGGMRRGMNLMPNGTSAQPQATSTLQ